MQGPSNLLFILTAAGHLNYAGTKHWLAHTDPHIVANIQVPHLDQNLIHFIPTIFQKLIHLIQTLIPFLKR